MITELPEAGLEVTWLKDNVPLSLTDEKYETINQDTSYLLVIPDVSIDDGGEYKVQGGGFESTVPLSVQGLEIQIPMVFFIYHLTESFVLNLM